MTPGNLHDTKRTQDKVSPPQAQLWKPRWWPPLTLRELGFLQDWALNKGRISKRNLSPGRHLVQLWELGDDALTRTSGKNTRVYMHTRSHICLCMSKKAFTALAGWLSRLESRPVHHKVIGSSPGQGMYLGCRFDSQLGCVQKATD